MYKGKNAMNLHHILFGILSLSLPISTTYSSEQKLTEQNVEWQQILDEMNDAISESDYQEALEEKRNTPPPSEFVVTCRKIGLVVLLQLLAFKQSIKQTFIECKEYLCTRIGNHERK